LLKGESAVNKSNIYDLIYKTVVQIRWRYYESFENFILNQIKISEEDKPVLIKKTLSHSHYSFWYNKLARYVDSYIKAYEVFLKYFFKKPHLFNCSI